MVTMQTDESNPFAFDNYGNDGTFPYTCTTCGVTCESIEELADPDHHDWPR